MSTVSRLRVLAPCVALGALIAPAPASADGVVAGLARATPIAAHGGVVAWSDYDGAAKRYRLVIRVGGASSPAPVADSVKPFDVSLGPDARGRVVALYSRCRRPDRGCDIYRYDIRARRERKLSSVSSSTHDEAWPVQWRDRIAFVRRARSWVRDIYDPRPDPAAKRRGSTLLDCDVPYVRTLSARASRRLDRAGCGRTDGMSIRGDRIVQVTSFYLDFNAAQSQVRVLRARGGSARVIANTTGGLDGVSSFVSPSQSATAVWLTRVGDRDPQNILRIDLARAAQRPGRLRPPMTEADPGAPLAGRVVRDDRGTFWYVQSAEPSFSEGEYSDDCVALQPCRLIQGSADPFSSTARTLAPRLRLSNAPYEPLAGRFADGIALSGSLVRDVVRGHTAVAREPLAGIAVELLSSRRFDGAYATTGLTARTDASGAWSFTLRAPLSDGYYVAVARGAGLASSIVEVATAAEDGR